MHGENYNNEVLPVSVGLYARVCASEPTRATPRPGLIRVEADLPVRRTENVCHLKMKFIVMEQTTSSTVPFDAQISESIKDIKHFCGSLTVPEITAFQIVYLKTLDQGRRVQRLHRRHSAANINLCKSSHALLRTFYFAVFEQK